VILPEFVLPLRVDQHWKHSGMDSIQWCFDVDYFKTYPHKISYDYNSRGFRDEEWPSNLSNAIWCFGDSFTVGLGCPREHTWTYLLQQQTNCSTINVSMDGASNTWITRKCLEVIQEINPKIIVIQWSYTHRRESDDITLSDEDRRLPNIKTTFVDDIKHTIDCINQIERAKTGQVIHSFIPEFIDRENKKLFDLAVLTSAEHLIPEFAILDLARDGKHYDIKTAQQFVDDVVRLL
jgi:hypothetical protein